jgi:hypothetical protein
MKEYRIAITALDENNDIYERVVKIVAENMVINVLVDNIKCKELFPSSILSDAKRNGSAVCWCGTKGYGYNVKKLI